MFTFINNVGTYNNYTISFYEKRVSCRPRKNGGVEPMENPYIDWDFNIYKNNIGIERIFITTSIDTTHEQIKQYINDIILTQTIPFLKENYTTPLSAFHISQSRKRVLI